MSNLKWHAEEELKALGYNLNNKEEGPNKWIVENILELINTFSKQGHSGSSAPYVIELFSKLALFKPLGPLTGKDEEWCEVVDGELWQNRRASHVFKDATGKAWDINGRICTEPDGWSFAERVYIKEFPYTPTTEYINIPKREE